MIVHELSSTKPKLKALRITEHGWQDNYGILLTDPPINKPNILTGYKHVDRSQERIRYKKETKNKLNINK